MNSSPSPSVLRQLSEVANFLDYELTQLHALLKTSKSITDMCVHYTRCEEQRLEKDSMPEYLQDAIVHLGHTVIYHMGVVCEEVGNKFYGVTTLHLSFLPGSRRQAERPLEGGPGAFDNAAQVV